MSADPAPPRSATEHLPPDTQVVLRLQRVEDAIGKDAASGMRGDITELKAEMGHLRTDVMAAVGGGVLDKLLNADAKKLGILLSAVVVVVAIIWQASISYGSWTVNNTAQSGDGASMVEEVGEP